LNVVEGRVVGNSDKKEYNVVQRVLNGLS